MGEKVFKKQVEILSNGVNAICHRDYTSTANVQIRIFDDRIEIWNPGKLLDGLTVEKLKEKHESIPRSPL